MKQVLVVFVIMISTTLSRLLDDRSVLFSYDECKLQQDLKLPTIILDRLDVKVSHRVVHQLVSRIFAIFLKEIYHFDNVYIDSGMDYSSMDRLNENSLAYAPVMEVVNDQNMNPAVNLVAPIPPNFHVAYSPRVFQGGSLTHDLFRYGLFVLNTTSPRKYSYEDFMKNNSRYYNIIKDFKFSPNEIERNVQPFLDTSYGNKGFFIPQQCNSDSEPCAIVLTSFYNDTKFFIDHIDEFKFKLKIYFLGDRLNKVITDINDLNIKMMRTGLKQPLLHFLVLHWTPSEITDNPTLHFENVEMPKCEIYLNENRTCRYEIVPVKTVINDLAKKSSVFSDLMNNVHFTSLKPLLNIYHKFLPEIEKIRLNREVEMFNGLQNENETIENIYNKIACLWLQENPEAYSTHGIERWINVLESEIEISIGGLFPDFDNTTSNREYNSVKTAADMALARANTELKDTRYRLEIKRLNSKCRPDAVLRKFIELYNMRNNLIGVLGPECSEAVEPIAAISKHFKMSVITYSAEGISFDNREEFPHFYRTIGETKQYEDVYAKLFMKFDWNRLAALTEDGMKYTQYISDMETTLKEKGINLMVNKKFTRVNDKERQLENFKTYLKELRANPMRAKIIIADVHDDILMKSIMCAASKLTMTAASGYVWFLPVYVSMKMNETSMEGLSKECTMNEVRNAMDGHFSLSYASFGEDSDVIDGSGNETIAKWKEDYLGRIQANKTQYADVASYTYDAIWVYVIALKQLIKEDNLNRSNDYMHRLKEEKTMQRLTSIINNMNFQGVSGRIQFNYGGSRFIDVNVLQWQKNDFVLVGTYKPKIENRTIVDGILQVNNRIVWHNGERPTDGRESCALKGIVDFFGTDCNTFRTAMIIILVVLVAFLCSGLSFIFWKRKYDKKLEKSTQIMANYGMVVNGIELTKWEIPRENVVINRKLGEGAFGTVYGGEALINEEDGWAAVAIKTLKSGSNAENRLDFLAESETMKRFEHKNIVKLLAVCLQAEPLFTIMEYMLYGDLKTFLLARRHLVNERIGDESDISPKRLTLMALDVARGLSYLGSMNYVHRDVACRNCMINAQRIVKIGDFGMARPVFESDYYRFARKGMLPVRWMSPESLDGGIFSHASDIWSYGVLLYEIVTLGAFPFQGLNNNQVLDTVKMGNHIKIPLTCKPHLKALMQSCFSFEKEKRPGASTIVEFITNYPRMLTPSMDAPKPNLDDQVNLIKGETDQLEVFEQQIMENRDRSPATTIDFLRTSVSSSALQNHSNPHVIQRQDQSSFEYLDMKLPKKPNGICLHDFHPDLTATLPNGNYNPVEPLLRNGPRQEISKSNLSLMKYVPMCGGFGKNSKRSLSPDDCTSEL